MVQEGETGQSRDSGGRRDQSGNPSTRAGQQLQLGAGNSSDTIPLLVSTDSMHNYLHLNVNSPKHHAATMGMDQGWVVGRTGLLSFPALY